MSRDATLACPKHHRSDLSRLTVLVHGVRVMSLAKRFVDSYKVVMLCCFEEAPTLSHLQTQEYPDSTQSILESSTACAASSASAQIAGLESEFTAAASRPLPRNWRTNESSSPSLVRRTPKSLSGSSENRSPTATCLGSRPRALNALARALQPASDSLQRPSDRTRGARCRSSCVRL